jgi:protein O-mannosyl-transferase
MGRKNSNRARQMPDQKQVSVRPAGRLAVAVLLAGTFLAFANTLGHGFVYDDQTFILENNLIRSFSNLPTIFTTELWFYRTVQDRDPTTETNKATTPYYRPVFSLYCMICWHLFQEWAAGWHLASILIHLVAVYFGFLILREVTGDVNLSVIGALIFAVHPLRSESVAWISGVSDPLLAALLFPSFYFYMLFRKSGRPSRLAASLLLFLFAAFAKEPAVALPIFVGAYELLIAGKTKPLMERIKPAILNSAMFLAPSIIYFAMRYRALGFVLGDDKFTNYNTAYVFLTIPLVIWKYIGLLVWPVKLSLFHETMLVSSPVSLGFILPVIGLIALLALFWRFRGSRTVLFGGLWFAVHLLPVLNLKALTQEFLVQERYVYIPSLGFSLVAAIAVSALPVEKWISLGSRQTARTATVALIILLLGGKSIAQNRVWKEDLGLWEYGAEAAPDQRMSQFILGFKYFDRHRTDKVVESLENYVRLDPKNVIVLGDLASAHLQLYEQTGDRAHVDRAIALSEQALAINDQLVLAWDTLGHAYTYDTEKRNYALARTMFERGLNIQPDNAMVNFHMGAVTYMQRQPGIALPYLENARRLGPDIPDTYKFLAYLYQSQGRDQEAIENFDKFLRMSPNSPDARKVSQDLQKLRGRMQSPSPQS